MLAMQDLWVGVRRLKHSHSKQVAGVAVRRLWESHGLNVTYSCAKARSVA